MRFHLFSTLTALLISLSVLSGCSEHIPTGDSRTYGNGEPIKQPNQGAALQPQQQRSAYEHSALRNTHPTQQTPQASQASSFYQGPYSQPFYTGPYSKPLYTGPYTTQSPSLYESPKYRSPVKRQRSERTRTRTEFQVLDSRFLSAPAGFSPIRHY